MKNGLTLINYSIITNTLVKIKMINNYDMQDRC